MLWLSHMSNMVMLLRLIPGNGYNKFLGIIFNWFSSISIISIIESCFISVVTVFGCFRLLETVCQVHSGLCCGTSKSNWLWTSSNGNFSIYSTFTIKINILYLSDPPISAPSIFYSILKTAQFETPFTQFNWTHHLNLDPSNVPVQFFLVLRWVSSSIYTVVWNVFCAERVE